MHSWLAWRAHKDGLMANKLKKLGLPDSFCFAPYVNLDLDQNGSFMPCYRSKEEMGRWKRSTENLLHEYNNQKMQELRNALWNGQEHANCRQCHAREADGVTSTRQEFNKHYMENIVEQTELDTVVEKILQDPTQSYPSNISTMEIRPHGVCNLACAHCSPESSTGWMSLLRHQPELIPEMSDVLYLPADTTGTNINVKYVDNFINCPESLDDFYELATNLKSVHFTGGEPLMDKKHLDWLTHIQNKKSIDLRYHTNLQHKLYDKFYDKWNEFKSLRIFASIDTSKKFYGYFRYGSDWDLMHENITNLVSNVENITVKATITVNFITMLDWLGVVEYIVENDLDMHVAFVDPPHPLSAVYMPQELKTRALVDLSKSLQIISKYKHKRKATMAIKQVERVVEFLTRGDEYQELPEKTYKYFKQLDKIYDMSIVELCPRMYNFLSEKDEISVDK